MPPTIGQPAPTFSLKSTSGQNVSLADYRGTSNVLLAFFPLAFTSVCTAELCSFSEDYERFRTTETVVLPISVDAVPSLTVFKKQERMQVDLLSDFKRDVSRAYGVLDEERFTAKRSYFLVDKEGVLRWRHVEEHGGHRRTDDELLQAIADLL